MVTLLLPFVATEEFTARRKGNLDFLASEEPILARRGWEVVHHRISPRNPYAYAELLRDRWGDDGPLVILEHDVVPLPGQLEELVACPEPICCVPYPLNWCLYRGVLSRGDHHLQGAVCYSHARTVPSYRTADPTVEGGYDFGQWDDAFADLTSLGCTKFSPIVRTKVHPHPRVEWYGMDDSISRRTLSAGYRAHIHLPTARHDHPAPIAPHHSVRIDGHWVECHFIGNVSESLRQQVSRDIATERARDGRLRPPGSPRPIREPVVPDALAAKEGPLAAK